MILLDTNVVVDLVRIDSTPVSVWSRATYRTKAATDQFFCNLIVLAEFAAQGETYDAISAAFDRLRIDVVDLSLDGALAAGRAHALYRQRGGSRAAILADFLIAGHAEALGASLMTRDRRLASYFPNLTLITPETHP